MTFRFGEMTKYLLGKLEHRFGLVNLLNRRGNGYLVLMYHSTPRSHGQVTYPYIVNQIQFERQLEYMKNHFKVTRLSDLVQGIKERRSNNCLEIAITFDDGYKNNYTVAYPQLRRHEIPATIFVVSSFAAADSESFLSWKEIREMNESGLINFGAHSHRHINLTSLRFPDVVDEIKRSKDIIEQELGEEILFFSYPGGGFNEEIKYAVRACGFEGAFKDRLTGESADIYELGRISIERRNGDLDDFAFEIAKHRAL